MNLTRRDFLKGGLGAILAGLFGKCLSADKGQDGYEQSACILPISNQYTCARCGKAFYDDTEPDVCWYCQDFLCGDCWEDYGHCGHPEADAQNELAKNPTYNDDSDFVYIVDFSDNGFVYSRSFFEPQETKPKHFHGTNAKMEFSNGENWVTIASDSERIAPYALITNYDNMVEHAMAVWASEVGRDPQTTAERQQAWLNYVLSKYESEC